MSDKDNEIVIVKEGTEVFVEKENIFGNVLIPYKGDKECTADFSGIYDKVEKFVPPFEQIWTVVTELRKLATGREASAFFAYRETKKGKKEFRWIVPKQEVTTASVNISDIIGLYKKMEEEGWEVLGHVHLHPSKMLSYSKTDEDDWVKTPGLYLIVPYGDNVMAAYISSHGWIGKIGEFNLGDKLGIVHLTGEDGNSDISEMIQSPKYTYTKNYFGDSYDSGWVYKDGKWIFNSKYNLNYKDSKSYYGKDRDLPPVTGYDEWGREDIGLIKDKQSSGTFWDVLDCMGAFEIEFLRIYHVELNGMVHKIVHGGLDILKFRKGLHALVKRYGGRIVKVEVAQDFIGRKK